MIKITDARHVDIKKEHLSYFENQGGLDLLKLYARQKYKHSFEKKVLVYLKDNYKNIIIGNPDELTSAIESINKLINGNKVSKITTRKLQKVFDYNTFSTRSPGVKETNWGGYLLAKNLDVGTCPYCNRQYITTIRNFEPKKKGRRKSLWEGQTRGTLDHFFDKARYPYLALSLYNLIPSCKVCNSDFKGSYEMSMEDFIHPYKEGFGSEVRFTVVPKRSISGQPYDVTSLLGSNNEFQVDFRYLSHDPNFTRRAKNNIELFKIKELYNFHKEEVRELMQKSQHYTADYIDTILSLSGTLFNSREEVVRFVISSFTDQADFNRRTLSKFTSDIANELGLLRNFDTGNS
ncbi:hypothetical protein KQ941_01850 [Paenibacillus xylanexedens]|uniref:hypothetical protein n=1 Tax=Paenibacillus xylanexedens TaxID=528191 RepID=UPI001F3EFC80|nr:hypothetical protein [Paenibacillus xylanexedens]MCF7753169.1 hypothetical protein [Paenibacillus xylanexedens]